MNNINEFLKEYYILCKKYNIQLVVSTNTYSTLNISDLSDDILTEENTYAVDVDIDFNENKVYFWNSKNELVNLDLNN